MTRTSSSRPTPGRGYQTLPAAAAAQYEQVQQDDLPNWARGPFTLYISYLHAHVPEKMIFSVIRQTGLGMMRRQGAIEISKHDGRDGGYPFQSVKIHFDFLFTRGDQREQNLQVLDHLLHGGDDAHFQVVYQAARANPKTGKDEPDRFWKVKAWHEGQPSASPAPAIKISLHGGSVGPKEAAASGGKPSAQELRVAAQRRAAKVKRGAADADGFVKAKTRGSAAVVSEKVGDDGGGGGQAVGGGFAALTVSPSGSSSGADSSSTSPNPMSKSAKKNARRRAAKQRKAEQANGGAAVEVAQVIAVNRVAEMTEEEMRECDAAIAAAEAEAQPRPTNDEIACSAAEFLAENQLREEGAENAAAWQMDASTGSILFHDEMTAEDAAVMVPACETLDSEGLREEFDVAENGGPTPQRVAAGVPE